MKRLKWLLLCIMILSGILFFRYEAKAQGLFFDGIGFRYLNADGSYATDCRRCVNNLALHFNSLGYADKTGFEACAGQWKNTKKGKRYFFDDGKVPNGPWLLADGKFYTFDNGYVVNSSNTAHTGSAAGGSTGGSSGSAGSSSGGSTGSYSGSGSNTGTGSNTSTGSNGNANNYNTNNTQQAQTGQTNNTQYTGTGQPDSTPSTNNSGSAGSSDTQLVWIPTQTVNGKYHSRSDCSGMYKPVQVTLAEAKQQGYPPCSKCIP